MDYKLLNLEYINKGALRQVVTYVTLFTLAHIAFIQASEANDFTTSVHKALQASTHKKQQSSNPISFQFKGKSWSILGYESGSLRKGKFAFLSTKQETNVPYYEKNIVHVNLNSQSKRSPINPTKNLTVSAAKGENEPFSLILNTYLNSLKDIKLTATPFINHENNTRISEDSIDLKIVKKWYQSGNTEKRSENHKKYFVEELLLNDDSLVQVDMEYKINIVRNIADVEDASNLLPFNINSRQEKKIWVNIHVPASAETGIYTGGIKINYRLGEKKFSKLIPVELKVHNFLLDDSLIPYCLYYFGSKSARATGQVDSNYRSYQQMLEDFYLIKKQGFSTVVLIHEYNSGYGRPLDDAMKAMKINQLGKNHFIYRDLLFEKADNSTAYRKKLVDIKNKANQYGFKNVYIYNQDEKSLKEIDRFSSTLLTSKELGLHNAITIPLSYLKSLPQIDLAITRRNKKISKSTHIQNADIWAYHFPQAGIEAAEKYQMEYGRKLVMDGFDGSCNFAYQTQHTGKSSWDDWSNKKFRPHNMTYPALSGNIRTIQLEGYREGIDDVRYASTLVRFIELKKGKMTRQEKLETLRDVVKEAAESSDFRKSIVERIAILQEN